MFQIKSINETNKTHKNKIKIPVLLEVFIWQKCYFQEFICHISYTLFSQFQECRNTNVEIGSNCFTINHHNNGTLFSSYPVVWQSVCRVNRVDPNEAYFYGIFLVLMS